jgi:hypothetical protein
MKIAKAPVERCLACEAEGVGALEGSRFDACLVISRYSPQR